MSLRKTNSLTFRITLLFATASIAVLLALGFLIRDSVDKHFEEQDVAVLSSNAQLIKQALSRARSSSDVIQFVGQIAASTSSDNRIALFGFDREGKQNFSIGEKNFPQALLTSVNQINHRSHRPITWEENGKSFRGIAEKVSVELPGTATVVIATAMDILPHHHFMDMFQVTLWWFVGIAAALMGFLGWVAARHGLAPLKRIQRDATAISASRLSQRLSVADLPLELADLGNTINGMLSRLEESFKRLSDFSADIAHELRTPVSNLMTQTQVALSKPRTADEYQEILVSNAEELEIMSRMISDMLFLAKADHGLIAPKAEVVVLEQEFEDLFGFYEALVEEKSIRLEMLGTATINGDRLMLRRAFSNLLSNAIRHTPQGEKVSVAIQSQADGATTVEVSNVGNIPAEHLPRLFDRFYRVDPARHEASEGAGLGLAITESIIRMHAGSISVQSADNKVVFRICLPRSPAIKA